MIGSMASLRQHIRVVEMRIERHGNLIHEQLHRATARFAGLLHSPLVLAAVAASGVLLGWLGMRRQRSHGGGQSATFNNSALGAVSAFALAWLQRRYGSPVALLRRLLLRHSAPDAPAR